jgi:hypothetical protein
MLNHTPNFASILNQSPTEVVRPKPLPVGTYLCKVGDWERGESSKKKTPFVKFNLRPLSALADVDETDLAEIGGLEGRRMSITFYITEDAIAMLDEFHQNCGVDLADGTTRMARNDAVIGADILAVVAHRIDDQDPSRIFPEVRRTAAAD